MLSRTVKIGIGVIAVLLLLALSIVAVYVVAIYPQQSIRLDRSRLVEIPPGQGFNALCRRLAEQQVIARCAPLKWYSQLYPELHLIKAGSYMIETGLSHQQLLVLLSSGKEYQFSITFVEGERLTEWLARLASKDNLVQDIGELSQLNLSQLNQRLNNQRPSLEGLLFPDTYYYSAGSSSFSILTRAYQSMATKLAQQWEARDPDLPYQSAYEALIMASIIEKETGLAAERSLIASVFINRLAKKMRLQTDPTVIYGLGEQFNGDITYADLKQETPYNTYRIKGLPPTPIAMPGIEAIHAALHPATTEYYYFVAKKDRSHHFSTTLEEHNRAVSQYQLGIPHG